MSFPAGAADKVESVSSDDAAGMASTNAGGGSVADAGAALFTPGRVAGVTRFISRSRAALVMATGEVMYRPPADTSTGVRCL